MPAGPIPSDLAVILQSDNVALLSTIGPSGEPHISPIWFLWDGTHVAISLIEGKQKERNLRRDPRIALAVIDRTDPTHYLEVRGTVQFAEDLHDAIFEAISRKYTGRVVSLEPEGTRRFVARFAPGNYTFQRPIDFSAPPRDDAATNDEMYDE